MREVGGYQIIDGFRKKTREEQRVTGEEKVMHMYTSSKKPHKFSLHTYRHPQTQAFVINNHV